MLAILMQIAPLFIIILIGIIFGKWNARFNETTVSELNKYAYYIGYPCLMINSLMSIDEVLPTEIKAALLNVGILVLLTVLILVIGQKVLKNQRLINTYFICCIFGNIAYLGFPLVTSLNASYKTGASLHIAGYLIVIFTLGIGRLEYIKGKGDFSIKKLAISIATNPLLLSTVIGLAILMFKIPIPDLIAKTIKMVAVSASPTVLLALGIFMIKHKLHREVLFHASTIAILKLLLVPLLFLICSVSLFSNQNFDVSIIMAAMPVAITPFVLSEIYDLDKRIVVTSIIVSTILSIISIPLIIYLM